MKSESGFSFAMASQPFMFMPLPEQFMVTTILFMLMIDSAPLVYYWTVGRFPALAQH